MKFIKLTFVGVLEKTGEVKKVVNYVNSDYIVSFKKEPFTTCEDVKSCVTLRDDKLSTRQYESCVAETPEEIMAMLESGGDSNSEISIAVKEAEKEITRLKGYLEKIGVPLEIIEKSRAGDITINRNPNPFESIEILVRLKIDDERMVNAFEKRKLRFG